MEEFKVLSVCNILNNFYAINKNGVIIRISNNREMKCKLDKDGYLCLSLCTNELTGEREHKRKMFRVATLVLKEFVGEPPVDLIDATVDHRDANKLNNNVSNLRWVERTENSRNRMNVSKGEKNGTAKLTEKEVIEIKYLLKTSNLTLRQIGNRYGVHKSTISNIKRGVNWCSTGTL